MYLDIYSFQKSLLYMAETHIQLFHRIQENFEYWVVVFLVKLQNQGQLESERSHLKSNNINQIREIQFLVLEPYNMASIQRYRASSFVVPFRSEYYHKRSIPRQDRLCTVSRVLGDERHTLYTTVHRFLAKTIRNFQTI